MSQVVITGFAPYSILTHVSGNPSEAVAGQLRARLGEQAHAEILSADGSCLSAVRALASRPGTSAIVMFGAEVQLAPVTLELEGVSKANGLFDKKTVIPSPAAEALKAFATSIGVPARTAPLSPLVYWCLRSYGAALEIANAKGVPCIFMHVNAVRISGEEQLQLAWRVVERMLATRGRGSGRGG